MVVDKKVLVISQKNEPSTDEVLKYLIYWNVPFVRINDDDIVQPVEIVFDEQQKEIQFYGMEAAQKGKQIADNQQVKPNHPKPRPDSLSRYCVHWGWICKLLASQVTTFSHVFTLREKNNPSPKLTKTPIERLEEPIERPKANLNAALAAFEQTIKKKQIK